MSRRKDRESFISALAAEYPSVPGIYEIARSLLREATIQQRCSEIQCSIRMTEEQEARVEKRDERSQQRAALLVAKLPGASLRFSGDPRGAPMVVVTASGRGDSWSTPRGICVPGQGLPARCFA